MSVAYSIDRSVIVYPNSTLSKFVMSKGKTSITLGTLETRRQKKAINISDDLSKPILVTTDELDALAVPIEQDYYFLDSNTDIKFDITNFDKNNLSEIQKEIENFDKDFDISDYKITYNVINKDEKYGHILFTYYIDDIETNKVYLVNIKNNKVQEIVLAGTKKQNVKNFENAKKAVLSSKIASFENNKKASSIQSSNIISFSKAKSNTILNNNKKVNISALSGNTEKIEEKYFYDFNDEKLYYMLTQFEKVDNLMKDGNQIKIAIE